MKLRELIEILPCWTTVRIVSGGSSVEINSEEKGVEAYREFLKEGILDAEVSLIDTETHEIYEDDIFIIRLKTN